jgi:hypothetical protein
MFLLLYWGNGILHALPHPFPSLSYTVHALWHCICTMACPTIKQVHFSWVVMHLWQINTHQTRFDVTRNTYVFIFSLTQLAVRNLFDICARAGGTFSRQEDPKLLTYLAFQQEELHRLFFFFQWHDTLSVLCLISIWKVLKDMNKSHKALSIPEWDQRLKEYAMKGTWEWGRTPNPGAYTHRKMDAMNKCKYQSVPCFFASTSISDKNICSFGYHNAHQKAQLTYKPIQRESQTLRSVGSSLIKDVKTSRSVANPYLKTSSSSSTELTNFPTKSNGWSTVNDVHNVSNKKTMFLLLFLLSLCLVLHEVNFRSAMVLLHQNVNSSQK